MKLDTLLEILQDSLLRVKMFIDDRLEQKRHPIPIEYATMEDSLLYVLSALNKINDEVMTYNGDIYRQLASRFDGKQGMAMDREVITILRYFKEYSYYMFPNTRYESMIDNEVPENEKWRRDCVERSEIFKECIHDYLGIDGDIVKKATSRLFYYIRNFSIMLDCVLLENNQDLLQIQERCKVWMIECHSDTLLSYYTGMKGYGKELANKFRNETEVESEKKSSMILPLELLTPKAMMIWDKAKKAGWINEDYSFNGTKYQKAYAAKIMGKALGIKHYWKLFESLWRCKYLAQTDYENRERIGKVERAKEIEEVFSL